MGNLATEKTLTANHVNVFANGEGRRILIGTAQSAKLDKSTGVNLGMSMGLRPVYVVGDTEPQEHVDGAHSYTVRVDLLVLRRDQVGDPAALLQAGDIDIEGMDRHTGRMVFAVEGCRLADVSMNIAANAQVAKNLSFMARTVRVQ